MQPVRYAERVLSGAAKQVAPAADRNKEAIGNELERLLTTLPAKPRVLEISSGTGQHASYLSLRFAHELASIQPSDVDPGAIDSIRAYTEELHGLPHAPVLPPLTIDVGAAPQAYEQHVAREGCELVLCANLLHISPPSCTPGLAQAASRALVPHGVLAVYGPFLVDGKPTTDSNAAFDLKLKGMNPEYGLRDVEAVRECAERAGFTLERRIAMPANNFMLVFRKT